MERMCKEHLAYLELFHGDNAVVVGIDDLLKLLLPLTNPVVINVLALLVLHRALGERDELGQRQLFVSILIWEKQ